MAIAALAEDSNPEPGRYKLDSPASDLETALAHETGKSFLIRSARSAPAHASHELQEIIVTAQKRERPTGLPRRFGVTIGVNF